MGRTRAILIDTAERLFAQHGLDGVSLRQIAAAAGQRNVAAVHYHFTSKNELLRAIIERRLSGINRRREELMRRMEAEGRSGDPRALVEAVALPILEADADGGCYARFLAHVLAHPKLAQELFGDLDPSLSTSIGLVLEWTPRVLSHLPEHLHQNRSRLCQRFILTAIVDRQEQEVTGVPTLPRKVFLQDLIDSAAGLLAARTTGAPEIRYPRNDRTPDAQ